MMHNMNEIERIHDILENGDPNTLTRNEIYTYMSYCFNTPLEIIEARAAKGKAMMGIGEDLMECPDFGDI